MMKQMGNKIAIVLALLLFLMPLGTIAANAGKTEVVYANLFHTGAIEEITVVNGFETPQEIVDFGAYESVLNLTDEVEMTLENDRVTVNTETFPFYYQGKLKEKKLPWDIQFTYFLDDKEGKAEELLGKDGDFRMEISVQPVKGFENFTDSFLLQISIPFANAKFNQITAEGATIASQGEMRVVNFSVLPGKEAKFVVEAEANQIELEAIQVAGLPFSMEFAIPDLTEQTKQFVELHNAIAALSSGVNDYTNGVSSIYDASGELKEGASGLSAGAYALQKGLSSLTGGLRQYDEGLSEYVAQLESGISKFSVPINFETGGLVQLEDGANQLAGGLSQFHEGQKQALSTDGAFYQGLSQVTQGAEQLQGGLALFMNGDGTTPGILAASGEIEKALQGMSAGLSKGMNISTEDLSALTGGFDTLAQALGQYADGLTQITSQVDVDTMNTLITQLQNFKGSLQNTVNRLRSPEIDLTDMTPETHPEIFGLLQIMQEESYTIEAQLPLIDGAIQSLSGMVQFVQSTTQVIEGTRGMQSGLVKAKEQLASFDAGAMLASLGQLKDGMNTLRMQYSAFHQGLQEGLTGISAGLSSKETPGLVEGLQNLQGGYIQMGEELTNASGQLVPGARQIASGITQMRGQIESMMSNLDIGSQLDQLVNGSKQLLDGHRDLLAGANQLKQGMGQYANGVDAYLAGIGAFQQGILRLANGGDELSSGMKTLSNETQNMDQKIEEGIDDAMNEFMPADFEPTSFVSDKNPAPQSVQFVMMTEALRVQKEEAQIEETVDDRNIWERFLDLFR